MYKDYLLFINNKNKSNIDGFFYNIEKFKPSFKNGFFNHDEKKKLKDFIIRLYYFIISKKILYIYYVYDGNTIVHTSYVMGKNYKFKFMKNNDLFIGPCNTKSEYRGKSIYPYILNFISNEYNSNCYVLIRKENTASIRGIVKSNYIFLRFSQKNNIFKIYK